MRLAVRPASTISTMRLSAAFMSPNIRCPFIMVLKLTTSTKPFTFISAKYSMVSFKSPHCTHASKRQLYTTVGKIWPLFCNFSKTAMAPFKSPSLPKLLICLACFAKSPTQLSRRVSARPVRPVNVADFTRISPNAPSIWSFAGWMMPSYMSHTLSNNSQAKYTLARPATTFADGATTACSDCSYTKAAKSTSFKSAHPSNKISTVLGL
mmetsp:Transcript_117823/g.184119  ORF Transcript_117823/g.184119 Transcript_117823/m.184119 type:complete len:209 (-) Transcript_117823:276-902(-)